MLDTFRLLFDFGVLTLIWLVQLVIYPSFKYYQVNDLHKWHQRYTFLVSIVVMPLMLGQLGIVVYQLFTSTGLFAISSFVLIAMAWLLTFLRAVPLHDAIGSSPTPLPLIEKLIYINGFRTAAWTLSFVITLIHFLLAR